MEEEVQSLTCEICVEPMTETKKFSNNKRCAHPFCLDCIAKYIEAKIGENSTAEVPCPASNCDKFLDPISCRPILPAGLFERWCDVLCESAVLRGESSHCYCPSAGCSTLVLNECGGIITKSECPNCKKLFCFQCKITWHVGFGCNETEQLRDDNDFLFGELVVRNNWKRCPNCNFRVEKLDGCRSIQCRCGVMFCYACEKMKDECICCIRNVPRMDNHLVPWRAATSATIDDTRLTQNQNVVRVDNHMVCRRTGTLSNSTITIVVVKALVIVVVGVLYVVLYVVLSRRRSH